MAICRHATYVYESSCVEDTRSFGTLVASYLRDGDVLVLTGGLGVGKTQFTKGVSAGLGDESAVTSPTFAIMAIHDQGRIPLFHFDLYRLEHDYELEDTGIFDVLGYEGVCLLEWGEQFQDSLTDEYLSIQIERFSVEEAKPESRRICLEAFGQRADELARDIDAAVAEKNL